MKPYDVGDQVFICRSIPGFTPMTAVEVRRVWKEARLYWVADLEDDSRTGMVGDDDLMSVDEVRDLMARHPKAGTPRDARKAVIKGIKQHPREQEELQAFADFISADEITYKDKGYSEQYTIRRGGRTFVINVEGDRFDGGFARFNEVKTKELSK